MTTDLPAWFSRRMGAGVQRGANRVLQAAIVAALLAGVRRRDPSAIVNGVVSFVFTAMPRFLEGRYGARFRPWQRLWISAAALVHAAGMLGPYDRIWWWDHLAHTLSGIVVAGAADVVFRAEAERAGRFTALPRFRSAFVVGVTLGFGFVWETLEYAVHAVADRMDFEPLLVYYGRLDAILDLLFDLLGAGIVILFGRRTTSNVVESVTEE